MLPAKPTAPIVDAFHMVSPGSRKNAADADEQPSVKRHQRAERGDRSVLAGSSPS